VKERVVKVLKLLVYPFAYLFFLGLFGYLTFPFNLLRERIQSEFAKVAKPGQRLEIGQVSRYWFTGVDLMDVKLTLPPAAPSPAASPFGPSTDAGGGKETSFSIDEAHVRVRILPLLIGRVRVDFGAKLLEGEISGSVPVGGAGDVSLRWDKLDISEIEPLSAAIGGVPIKGSTSGSLELSAQDGKFNKANGALEMTVSGLTIADGKTKVMGVALPAAHAGDLTILADAKDGVLKLSKMQNTGPDVELIGDGKISVREPWDDSNLDLYVRFHFSDAYRGKNNDTKALLGDPNGGIPPLLEMDPQMKRSKRTDGFYGWHISGPLKKLRYDPSTADAAGAKKGGKPDSPFGPGGLKKPTISLPPPRGDKDSPAPAPPPPPRNDSAPAQPEQAPPPPPPPPQAPERAPAALPNRMPMFAPAPAPPPPPGQPDTPDPEPVEPR
jgi:type II secretion system protein N